MCLPVSAADWPQFRGPDGTGSSPETGLPDAPAVAWRADLPGRGLSSPAVVGGRVYVTASGGPRDDQLHVLAFDPATGQRLWHRRLRGTGSTTCHPTTCMAAPSPAADATGVYALFATGDLAAFDADGTLRWYRSLVGDYPTVSNQTGMASSPVLAGGHLVVPMENAGESFLAAVDVRTGRNVWKVARPRGSNWTTPVVRTAGGGDQVVFAGPDGVTAYDAATGERKWSADHGASIPSPSVAGDLLVAPSKGVTAVRLTADGPTEVWQAAKFQPGMTSPVVYGGRVYVANPKAGVVSAADLDTGKVAWQERVAGPYSGSPVAADGKLYLASEAGVLAVLAAAAEPQVLAKVELNDKVQATPAVAGGRVFVRGEKSLVCLGEGGR